MMKKVELKQEIISLYLYKLFDLYNKVEPHKTVKDYKNLT